MKNKVIAFITHIHTHTSESNKHTRNNTLTLVATVCIKIAEQPELHQLTTKQQRNIIQQRTKEKSHSSERNILKKTS